MGTSYAHLFMGYLEHPVWQMYGGKLHEVYGRYTDDSIGVTQMFLDNLNQFIQFFSSFNLVIKFTSISTKSVHFLETTTVHYKSTNSHSYPIHCPARMQYPILNSSDYADYVLTIKISILRPTNYLTSSMFIITLNTFSDQKVIIKPLAELN